MINRLLWRPPRCITPGGAHGQVISGGGRGPQPVLGEQPRAVELMDRSGDQGGISGAPPGALALAPGRGTPSYGLSLEALGSQHTVASPDQAEWPVQRAALEQESSGDEIEKEAHRLEIRTETPGHLLLGTSPHTGCCGPTQLPDGPSISMTPLMIPHLQGGQRGRSRQPTSSSLGNHRAAASSRHIQEPCGRAL